MSYTYTAKDKRVLAWCNTVRVKLGKKPVRRMGKSVAQTIGDVRVCRISRRYHRLALSIGYTKIPLDVKIWILYNSFTDRGDMPHFIQGEKA